MARLEPQFRCPTAQRALQRFLAKAVQRRQNTLGGSEGGQCALDVHPFLYQKRRIVFDLAGKDEIYQRDRVVERLEPFPDQGHELEYGGIIGGQAGLPENAEQASRQIVVSEAPDISGVHVIQLFIGKGRRRFAHSCQIKVANELAAIKELSFAVARPTDQGKIVDHRLGQIARLAELVDVGQHLAPAGQLFLALAQFTLARGVENRRQVSLNGHLPAKCLVQ